MTTPSLLRIAYPAAAWVGWGAWMAGVALGWALLLGVGVGLVVLLPWALGTAAQPSNERW